MGVFLFLLLYIMLQIKTTCNRDIATMCMALGDFHSRIQSPTVAMYPILLHYNSGEWLVLPLNFSVRVFLQPVVTVLGERSVRVFLVRKVYSDAGCSCESSRSSSAMVSLISDCITAMSRYTRCRNGSDA